MFKGKILVTILFSIFTISSAAKENKTFPALFAFGDSVLDTGNNNFLLTIMKGNYWPYGWNYRYKIPTGRFGNGRVFTDIMAEDLDIKKIVPAYRKFPGTKNDEYKTGICFASGGSGIDDLTSRVLRVLSTGDQLNDFRKYLKKLKKIVKNKKERNGIISNAVFLISEGNNDLGYFAAPTVLRLDSSDTYTTKMVRWTKLFLKKLYDQGARKFAVLGVMPIGCLPFHRKVFGSNVFGWCNSSLNKMSEEFNTKLRKSLEVYGLDKDFKGAKFVYVDIYGKIMDIIKHPKAYGFKEVKKSCFNFPIVIPCKNPDQYLFYDFGHPTEKTYKVISKPLAFEIRKALA